MININLFNFWKNNFIWYVYFTFVTFKFFLLYHSSLPHHHRLSSATSRPLPPTGATASLHHHSLLAPHSFPNKPLLPSPPMGFLHLLHITLQIFRCLLCPFGLLPTTFSNFGSFLFLWAKIHSLKYLKDCFFWLTSCAMCEMGMVTPTQTIAL